MNPVAKVLILAGVVLILAGLAWQLGAGKIPFGRLPGDIAVEKGNFRFYFPVMTSILLSILLTLIVWLIGRFRS